MQAGEDSQGCRCGKEEGLCSLEVNSPEYIAQSKKLANCLRHDAVKMGITIGEDGYVNVGELLSRDEFKLLDLPLLRKIVLNCSKQRFQLIERNDGEIFIRATQGHSIPFIRDDLLLDRINDPSELQRCFHGTYRSCLPAILDSGLNRMNLNHIHMSTSLPGSNDTVLSGMRDNTEVVIEIDVEAAMHAGITFFRSLNGVILSSGIEETGHIPPIYFKSVQEINTFGRN